VRSCQRNSYFCYKAGSGQHSKNQVLYNLAQQNSTQFCSYLKICMWNWRNCSFHRLHVVSWPWLATRCTPICSIIPPPQQDRGRK